MNFIEYTPFRISRKIFLNKSFVFFSSVSQYLTNNVNSNSTTLIKVIAAVLKFSPQQTQVVLEKEAHRKSLVRIFVILTSAIQLLYAINFQL